MKEEGSFKKGVEVSMRRWALRDLRLEILKWRGRSLHRGCVSGIASRAREHNERIGQGGLFRGLCVVKTGF